MAWPFDSWLDTPAANQQLSQPGLEARRRIALQLLSNSKKGYPKNIGEGLTAVGDAIGDRAVLNQLMNQETAFQKGVTERTGSGSIDPQDSTPPPPPPRTNTTSDNSDTTDTKPPVVTARDDTSDEPPIRPIVPLQPSLATNIATAAQPSSTLFSPYTPSGLGGTTGASALTPQQSASLMNPQPTALPANPLNMFPHDPINGNAPPGGRAALDPDVRNRITALTMPNATAPGVPPQNPMLGGSVPQMLAQPPLAAPSPSSLAVAPGGPSPDQRLALADTGTISDAPPVVPSGIRVAPPVQSDIQIAPIQVAQAGTKSPPPQPLLPPVNQMPPALRPPGSAETPPPAQPYSSIPQLGPKDPRQLAIEKAMDIARALGNTDELGVYQERWKRFEDLRQEKYKNAVEAWKAEPDRVKAADEMQQRAITQKREFNLGPGGDTRWTGALTEGRKTVTGLAQQAKVINTLTDDISNNRMFTGSTAEANVTKGKILHAMGFPLDPRVPVTEEFATRMAPLVAEARRMISGNQNISDADVRASFKASAADPKLEKDTILTALSEIRQSSLMKAMQHQQLVEQYATTAGASPTEQAGIYRMYGVPDIHMLIPQGAVEELRQNAHDRNVHKEFNDTYHTPGLSLDVLRYRR